jgi:large subunit ribosomal protein L31
MKKDIHPEHKVARVHCNGCDTTFETHSAVESITVEICSNCHPFYTGKQKLVDVAGRVDKFRARTAAAEEKAKQKASKKSSTKDFGSAEIAKKTLADLKK